MPLKPWKGPKESTVSLGAQAMGVPPYMEIPEAIAPPLMGLVRSAADYTNEFVPWKGLKNIQQALRGLFGH